MLILFNMVQHEHMVGVKMIIIMLTVSSFGSSLNVVCVIHWLFK